MPALKPTQFTAKIVWLGYVPRRDASLRSVPLTEAWAGFAGFDGEDHGGLTRPSCGRVTALYRRGTEIRNTRQFSIMSSEELAAIAATMGIENLEPSALGASIVIKGIPDLSHVPPASRLQARDGATLVIDVQNRPCRLPGPVIDETSPGKGDAFKTAAKGLRGVTAWVEREGKLRVGDAMQLFIPDQRAWSQTVAARS